MHSTGQALLVASAVLQLCEMQQVVPWQSCLAGVMQ